MALLMRFHVLVLGHISEAPADLNTFVGCLLLAGSVVREEEG